jgi:hypothetical protein
MEANPGSKQELQRRQSGVGSPIGGGSPRNSVGNAVRKSITGSPRSSISGGSPRTAAA